MVALMSRHENCSKELDPSDEEDPAQRAANGPSSDSTVPSEARETEEELLGFHLSVVKAKAGESRPPPAEQTRVSAQRCLPPSGSPTAVSTAVLAHSKLPAVDFKYAGVCINYCMTMCCLEQYGKGTTNDSIFHSKDIPSISVRLYMGRFFSHPALSPSAMLAGLLLIFRFTFIRFPVDIYSVHRLILTGATVGLKVQDDIMQGVMYLASLGGVKHTELITLQNTFCSDLEWNLFFYPEDYSELLVVMEQLLADPQEGELEAFCASHQDAIQSFNMKRLRVAAGMQWFLGEYMSTEPPTEEDPERTRVKAVFALHRWETIMKPWLQVLRQRCAQRDESINRVMEEDLQKCAKQAPSLVHSPISSPLYSRGSSDGHILSQVERFSGSWHSANSTGARHGALPPVPGSHFPFCAKASAVPYHRDPSLPTAAGCVGGRETTSRVPTGDFRPRRAHVPVAAAPPGMDKLTYAKPYNGPATRQSESSPQRPMPGQKRGKPQYFSDNYIQYE